MRVLSWVASNAIGIAAAAVLIPPLLFYVLYPPFALGRATWKRISPR